MSIKIRNNTTYALRDDISEFFNIQEEVQLPPDPYAELKETIYKLDIDTEEKSEIINKINKLKTALSQKDRNNIIKEIEEFKEQYNI